MIYQTCSISTADIEVNSNLVWVLELLILPENLREAGLEIHKLRNKRP